MPLLIENLKELNPYSSPELQLVTFVKWFTPVSKLILVHFHWKVKCHSCSELSPHLCIQICISSAHIQGRSHNLHHFDTAMGIKLGVFRFFHNQKNWFVRCVYHLHLLQSECATFSSSHSECIYCSLNVKMKMLQGTQRLWAFVLCLLLRIWLAKTWRFPIKIPWPTTPLHRMMYKVRSGISLVYLWSLHYSMLWIKSLLKEVWMIWQWIDHITSISSSWYKLSSCPSL